MLALLLLFVCLSKSQNYQSCSEDWQCKNVSMHSEYVNCVDNKCKCLDLGFAGNATGGNKCRCEYPREVEWKGSPKVAHCYSYAEAIAAQHEHTKADKQMAVVNRLLQALVYPEAKYIMDAYQANHTHPDHWVFDLFTDDARGRVIPVGTFDGRPGSVEYFFGSVNNRTRVDLVTIQKMISQGDIVYADYFIRMNTYNTTTGVKLSTYNLSQCGPYTLVLCPDGEYRIKSEDLIIRSLGPAVLSASGGRGFGFGTLAYATSICNDYFNPPSLGGAGCLPEYDPDGYYHNHSHCVHYFTNVFANGTMDDLYYGGNCIACRHYHMNLAKVNPEHHCSHVGILGGSKCETHDYKKFFTDPMY